MKVKKLEEGKDYVVGTNSRGERSVMYSHTAFDEPNSRWFRRLWTPEGLYLKKWPSVNTLVKEFDKQTSQEMAPVNRGRTRSRVKRARSLGSLPSSVSRVGESPRRTIGSRPSSLSMYRRRGTSLVARKLRPNMTKSVYRGRFKKVKRKGLKEKARYAANGVMQVEELTGLVTDPDCAYIQAQAVSSKMLIKNIIGALIRKLFRKAGINVSGWDDDNFWAKADVPGTVGVDYVGYKIGLSSYNGINNIVGVYKEVNLDNFTTLRTITDEFYPSFLAYVEQAQNAAANKDVLEAFTLWRNISVTDPQQNIILAKLELGSARVTFESGIEMKVQNRTLSATGGGEADDVSASVVQGRLYYFQGPPRPKVMRNQTNSLGTTGSWKFGKFLDGDNGVQSFGPNTMDTSYKEPPLPNQFWNVKRSSKVRLGPGAIKKCYLKEKRKNVPVLGLLKQIKYEVVDDTLDFFMYNNWKTYLIALEDIINLNGSVEINLAFEVERKTNVMVSEKKSYTFKPMYMSDTIAEI